MLANQVFKNGVTTFDVSSKMAKIPDGYTRIASFSYVNNNYFLTQMAFTNNGEIYLTILNQYGANLDTEVRCSQIYKRNH